ncbi:MAG: hypothetical protein LC793_18460 [Thermomicrobia bacterium]|nr:hypothetical protein [Thermomicrobia bacterium]
MSRIQAPGAWSVTHGSASITVAILDCGIYEAQRRSRRESDRAAPRPATRAQCCRFARARTGPRTHPYSPVATRSE